MASYSLRRTVLLLTAAIAGCTGRPVSGTLAVVHMEAVAWAICDAGPCELPVSGIHEPHCGYETSDLAAGGGTISVVSGVPAQKLTGILNLTERKTAADGTVSDSSNRRQLMSDFTRVYPAFGASGLALYDVDATGALRPLGDGGVIDGGEVTFQYEPSFTDGGVLIYETHRVVLVEPRAVTISDHSQDPTYGCCAQVGGETLTPLLALAALMRRSRRRRSLLIISEH